MKHIAIRVSGKVQGVYYRASTRQTAEVCAIRGFVRNEPDGSVYIEAEGEDENLDRFIGWCRIGPAGARVDALNLTEGVLRYFQGFRIER